MNADNEELELKDRLILIEKMIAEGRRSTESWGWVFVLWGLAYYVAIAWASVASKAIAWPVTMLISFAVIGILIWRKGGNQPGTTMGRAIGSIWGAFGIAMFVLFLALGFSGRLVDNHIFVIELGTMLGTANAASSIILKWKAQFACAVVWWAASAAACFGTVAQTMIVLLVAIFFCQIVFGIYAMICDSRRLRQVASHA